MFSEDFCNDNFDKNSGFVKFSELIDNENDESVHHQVKTENVKPTRKSNNPKIFIRVMTQDSSNQNPLALIHELRPDLIWTFIGSDVSGKMVTSFKMELKVGDQLFLGSGKTKKLAKYDASKQALKELFGINCSDTVNEPIKTVIVETNDHFMLDQKTADMIGFEVINAAKIVFESLGDYKKWNVLSSIVLTSDYDPNWFDIICLTTGTKCIKGDRLSMTGATIHDSHAEVLARRCFISYLYRQLLSIIDNNYQDRPEFILKQRDDGYGFSLKSGIRVNLFISTAPCGDARVFSPREESDGDPHGNRLSRGLLRAKIEAGEGTIPVKRGTSTLTWDGVLLGEQRLQFMSCSDKIALWNVTGVQGSLLSHFIEPIYLKSVILGSIFNQTHLIRAIHGRLNLNFDSESLKKLPFPYKVNTSKVAKYQSKSDEFCRQLTRSPNYAINWIKGDPWPEIISSDTGKILQNEELTSRLSKKSFFSSFRTILGRNSPKLSTSPLGLLIPTIYRDAKTSANDYIQARLVTIQAFTEQNLGDWIQVPAEVDLFG